MAIPEKPISRIEHYLARANGQNVQPPNPISRIEHYLAGIAGGVPQELLDDVADLKSALNEVRGSTRNIFDPTYLVTKAGWTDAGGVYSGTASKLHQNFNTAPYYPISGFKENTRYTLSLNAYTDGNEGTSGSGVMFYWRYSDGSQSGVPVPNATLADTEFF